jgi:uncharacterized membrane protein YjgN (DUF898 family)
MASVPAPLLGSNDAPVAACPNRFEQRGGILHFLPHAIVNAALVIASFNLYSFWASTNTRRYIWSTTLLGSVPLRYTGDGRELAFGFLCSTAGMLVVLGFPFAVLIAEINAWLQAVGVVGLLERGTGNALLDFVILLLLPLGLSLIAVLIENIPAVDLPAPLVIACGVVALIGWFYALTVSRHLAFRYLLRHTSWQGMHGDVAGSSFRYGNQLVVPELSRWFTLGWTGPWRYVKRWERLLGRVDALPNANGIINGAMALFFFVTVVLVTHYNQQAYRHVARSIEIGELRFEFTGSRRSLVRLYLTNLFMNVFSTGLAYYYTRLRIARYIVAHIHIQGDLSTLVSADRDPAADREPLGDGLETLVAASPL